MTSWATCGTGKPREVTTSKKEPEEKKANPHVDRYERLNLPRDVREEIGRKTKNLIDMGRCDFVSKRKMPNFLQKSESGPDFYPEWRAH